MQAENTPTICQVWKNFNRLSAKIREFQLNTDPILSSIATSTLISLEKKREKYLSEFHKIATLLNPATKRMTKFSAYDREEARYLKKN